MVDKANKAVGAAGHRALTLGLMVSAGGKGSKKTR